MRLPRSLAVSRRRRTTRAAAALAAALAVGLTAPPGTAAGGVRAAPAWAWPVAGPAAIARPYLAPATPFGPGHRGVDVVATAGADVRAPADGVVHFAGVVVDRPVLSIRHAGGVVSSFEPVAATVVAGDRVRRGDLVGRLEPGHCGSACLHLGARVDGEYVSPLLFLGGLPHSVLLPTRPFRSSAPRRARRVAPPPRPRPRAPATRTARR